MLKNWEMVKEAATAAEKAAGTAEEENAIYMDSIQGRLDSLKASWQVLSADFVQSDFLKLGTSGLNIIVDLLDRSVKNLGTFNTLALGGGFAALVKGYKSLS